MNRRNLLVLAGAALAAGVAAAPAAADTASFGPIGAEQPFTVPAGVTSIQVTATGESGGGTPPPFESRSRGAIVTGTLTVTPGQTLYVMVDSGGGSGGVGGGGGASDVRSAPGSLLSRLIVAGGGGSAAQGSPPTFNPGGDAGAAGSDGQGSVTCGGEPGTQLGGGAGGVGISTGGAGTLGTGGSGAGGGGGGGLFGGGAGGTYSSIPELTFGCGGGGGSSLVPPNGTQSLAAAGTPPSVLFTFTAAPGSGAPTPPGGGAPGGGTPGGGSGPGGGAPAGGSPGKPTLGGLTLPGIFLAAASGPSVSPSRGAKVSYRLSEPARLTFTVQRAALGRKRGPRCVARTPANAGAKRCTRWVKVPGSFTHAGVAGVNTFRFSGRIGGKTLRRGLHRLLGVAVDQTGDRSAAVQKKFRIAA